MLRSLQGDWVQVLRTLPAESVHSVVTSPPYWGLRDYSLCKCMLRRNAGTATLKEAGTVADGVSGQITPDDPRCIRQADPNCPQCHGAGRDPLVVKYQLGLERTREEYVQKIVAGFREVRRVLRKDGTLWLNLGDSYSNDTKWGGQSGNKNSTSADGGYQGQRVRRGKDCDPKRGTAAPGQPMQQGNAMLKPKDLVGMPWRVALALQADGWWLRQDIIWSKRNPMPESVTDRPTTAHEYIFLLTKSARYFYDAQAVREQVAQSQVGRVRQDVIAGTSHVERGQHSEGGTYRTSRDSFKRNGSKRELFPGPGQNNATHRPDRAESDWDTSTRNKRSVWEISTSPFPEAHFATFPPALVEPCILAGTSEHGCCAACGAPWQRVLQKKPSTMNIRVRDANAGRLDSKSNVNGIHDRPSNAREYGTEEMGKTRTTGWKPTCQCPEEIPIPAIVLDPFGGAGTVALVAARFHRSAILIDLKADYVSMGAERVNGDAPLFNHVEHDNVLAAEGD